jgi:hypothetical protein
MMFAREMQLVMVSLICPGSPTALFVTNVGGSFASHSFEWFAFSGIPLSKGWARCVTGLDDRNFLKHIMLKYYFFLSHLCDPAIGLPTRFRAGITRMGYQGVISHVSEERMGIVLARILHR